MRYIKQLGIIFSVTFAAEIMKHFIPLPIPASIYGLILMFAALRTGLIRLSQVRETAEFLIEIMPLMFIPAAVGLLESVDALRPMLLPVAAIMLITTVVVMGVTGRVAQWLLRSRRRNNE